MKKVFLTLGLFAVVTLSASSLMAQTAPTPPPAGAPGGAPVPQRAQLSPEQRAEKQTDMMQKNLGLSADQVTKVKQINTDYWTKVDEMRKNNANPQDMHTQMKALRDKRDADLKGVLTPDQYTKMTTAQENKGPRPGGQAPAPTPAPKN